MTQPLPNPDNNPETEGEVSPPSPPPRRKRRWWAWGIFVGLVLGGAGFAIAWFALLNYLSPILADLLTKELDRPVKLGPTSGLSLRGVRFGRSEIPPTAKDTDRAVVEAVDVTFNLWRVLTDKTLELNLTLVQPTAYVEQDLDGQWIATRLREQEGESEWKVDVKTIRAENANVIVVARDKKRALRQPVELNVDLATVRTYENYQLFEGDAKGKFIDGARFNVATTIRPQTWQGKVYLATQQLDLLYLNRLVEVPVILRSGKVSTNLEVELAGNPLKILPNATGIVALQNVSAKLDEKALGIQSPQALAQQKRQQQPQAIEERPPLYFLNNLPIAIPEIKQVNGRIAFQGQSARFESFTARVGQISAQLGGSVDAKTGFALNATTKPLTITDLLRTFALKKPPIPVAGEFEVALQAKGPFDKPIVTSQILSTKTIQFDRATFRDVRAQLAFATAKNTLFLQSLDAIPTQGGRVRGGGQVRFNKDKDPGQIALNFQAQNLPADAIAALYIPNLPLTLGPISARAQLLGPFTKIEDLKGQMLAQLADGGLLAVQNARIRDGRFFGTVAAAGVQLNRFLPANSPLRPVAGTGSALLEVSGPLQKLRAERLAVTGSGRAAIAGGTVTASNIRLQNGQFYAALNAGNVGVGQLAPKILPAQISLPSLGALTGTLQVAGRVTTNVAGKPTVGGLTGAGALGVAVAGGFVEARRIALAGDRWQADVTVRNVEAGRIATLSNLPPAARSLQQLLGRFSGNFQLAGSIRNFDLNSLAANGTGQTTIAGGTANLAASINRGNWFARILTNNVQLPPLTAGLNLPPVVARTQRELGAFTGTILATGNVNSFNPNTLVANATGQLAAAGGAANVNLKLNRGNWFADIAANSVQLTRLTAGLDLPAPVARLQQTLGAFTGNLRASGNLSAFNPNTLVANATGRLDAAGGTANVNLKANRGNWIADIAASGVQLPRLTAGLNLPVPIARAQQTLGAFTGNLRASGSLSSFSPNSLVANATGRLDAAGGTANVNLKANRGSWTADVAANNVQLNRLTAGLDLPAPVARAQQALGAFTGTLRAAGNLNSFDAKTLTASSRGRLNLAGGSANLDLNLTGGRWLLTANAREIQPQQLLANIPPQFQTPISADVDLRGTLSDLSLNAISATGSGRLNLAGGQLLANNLRLANGTLQTTLVSNNIELAGLVDGLRGRASGNIDVTANLANLTPEGIRARGNLNLSEEVLPLQGPVAATFDWSGRRLSIARATSTGLEASGYVDVNTAALRQGKLGLNAISRFDLNVNVQGLKLAQLSEQGKKFVAWPPNLAPAIQQTRLAGLADFNGNLRGTLTAPEINGTLALRDAKFNEFVLEPLVSGPIAFTPGQGGSMRLAGNRDRIEVALAADYKPNSFLIQVDELYAEGTRRGDILTATTRNVPIAYARSLAPPQLIPEAIAGQPLSGKLSGEFQLNLVTFAASGNIDIKSPIFSRISGDRLTASFEYANGSGIIRNGIFQQGETQYAIDGRIVQTARGPQFNAEVGIKAGRIQDILATAQIFKLADFTNLLQLPVYGKAGDVAAVPINITNQPLIQQLRRLAEIEALLAEQRRQRLASSPLPPLSEATGAVEGKISVAGSLADGLDVDFNLNGSNWKWGPFVATNTVARGTYQKGILSIRPFQMQLADGGSVSFAGAVGGENQSGQLQVEKFPVALIQEFVALPPDIGLTGFVNASAVLSGTQQNPQARGQLTVVDAELNQEKVESAQGNFSYNQGILNFAVDSIIAAGTEPLAIAGKFPYRFPLPNAVKPSSDVFELTLKLQNNALTILNALTRQQLIWKNGEGNVDVAIAGRYDQDNNRLLDLKANGTANLRNAEVASLLLADSLKNLNGQINFDFDKITVQSLTSQFGGGNVTAAGSLALTQPAPQENPLTISLKELAVNLKGLYTGKAGGNIQIAGAVLQPVLSGNLTLTDGRVLLTGLATFGAGGRGSFVTDGGGATAPGGLSQIVAATQFNNLELTLGNGLRLEQPLLVNFSTDGTIVLNGRPDDIAPRGVVRLTRGQINLFATQLRLQNGYDNVAIFRPEFGLNPRLDLRLVGSAIESNRTQTATEAFSSEIRESLVNFGSVETVRIEAIVDGFALALLDSLQVEPGVASAQKVRSVLKLTSSPPRSETQIIALLGGSFINAFSQDDAGIGLANLASNALLGSIQNALADSLGLSEFRIYPSVVPDTDDRTSTYGLAAELGFNVTDSLGVSVTQFLTPQVPTELNLRYRINDYVVVRGSSNFGSDYRMQVEYRQRF